LSSRSAAPSSAPAGEDPRAFTIPDAAGRTAGHVVKEAMSVSSPRATTTLWRPTGPEELELVRELDWPAWPPRLPEQPIFYPVRDDVVGRLQVVREFH
jgi:hypothetical protein